MTDAEIAAAEALAEVATAGPWMEAGHGDITAPNAPAYPDGSYRVVVVDARPHDAAFIAAARTGWQRALSEVRECRAALRVALALDDSRLAEIALAHGRIRGLEFRIAEMLTPPVLRSGAIARRRGDRFYDRWTDLIANSGRTTERLLVDLLDLLAHDHNNFEAFVGNVNRTFFQLNNERAAALSALRSRDARIKELEAELSEHEDAERDRDSYPLPEDMEIDTLRAEVERYRVGKERTAAAHQHDLAQARAEATDAMSGEVERYRSALAALVDALAKCETCGCTSTAVAVGSNGTVTYCDIHGAEWPTAPGRPPVIDMQRADVTRVALTLLSASATTTKEGTPR